MTKNKQTKNTKNVDKNIKDCFNLELALPNFTEAEKYGVVSFCQTNTLLVKFNRSVVSC